MTDRELLELAAKAAGIELGYWCPTNNAFWCGEYWNPLEDDGDALRLAVKLGFPVLTHGEQVPFDYAKVYFVKEPHNNPYTATRRAIVRAAAEIGKEMK